MLIGNLDCAGGWRICAAEGDVVIDLNRAAQLAFSDNGAVRPAARREAARAMPADIADWLALDRSEAIDLAGRWLSEGLGLVRDLGMDWAEARQLAYRTDPAPLAPPVPASATMLAIGLNYRDHAEEAQLKIPEYPVVFAKPSATLAAPGETLPVPAASHRIDYEGELAVVIGRRCKAVAEDEALAHVAGYTLANDISARDWQFRTSEMMIGKAFDGFCPLGPWLQTADEVPDPSALTFETKVGGEHRQTGRLTELIFGIPQLVSYLSQAMTLQPGDVILTGTPGGIGATRNPRRWLRAGEVVEITAARIGTLTTAIV